MSSATALPQPAEGTNGAVDMPFLLHQHLISHLKAKEKPMKKQITLWTLLVACAFTTGCTMTSTAKQWNGRVGPNGKPVYVKSHTNVGGNFLIFIPLFGTTTVPTQIDGLTQEIDKEKGDVVRIIESSSENYWYGWPPFTWVLTPVITTARAEYEPSPDVLANDRAEQEKKAAKQKK